MTLLPMYNDIQVLQIMWTSYKENDESTLVYLQNST